MKTKRLTAVPLTATGFTLAAFAVPLSITVSHIDRPGLAEPLLVAVSGLLAAAAMGRIGHFGDVGHHSLERVETAWTLIRRAGSRPLPSDHLRTMTGWAIRTLAAERHWAWGLKLGAGSLQWLATVLGLAALAGAAGCLLAWALALIDPELTAALPIAPYGSDALVLAVPALLWPVARFRLGPLARAELPTEAEFAEAQVELVRRLTALRQQAGSAAMTAVDHGLDGLMALAGRMAALAPPAGPDDLAGLSEIPRELA
jgi:hypothetical protein